MKAIEIVLATHGENLFWASGLESIITEYSTMEQFEKIQKRKKQAHISSQELRHFQLDTRDIFEFARGFKKISEFAMELKEELDEALQYNHHANQWAGKVLSGHKTVKIHNDTNLNEANHFLSHIISEYDNLAEYTAFLQGQPHDHCQLVERHILANLGKPFSCLPSATKQTLGWEGHDMLARQFAEIITKKKTSKSEWSAGACFMASRAAIQKNPISWYKMVLDEAKVFKDAKFALERVWAIVIRPDEDWS